MFQRLDDVLEFARHELARHEGVIGVCTLEPWLYWNL